MDISRKFNQYKVKVDEGSLFDPVRGKPIKATPEEIIRQKTIKYMRNIMKVPKQFIGVEIGLASLGATESKKRLDICIYSPYGNLIGVVECKAYRVADNQTPYDQVMDYVSSLNARFFFVVDGVDLNGFERDPDLDCFVKLSKIPTFDEMVYDSPPGG